MNPEAIREQMSKLNRSQRRSIRERVIGGLIPNHDRIRVFKAKRGAHVYVRTPVTIHSVTLGPRGRIVDYKQRRA